MDAWIYLFPFLPLILWTEKSEHVYLASLHMTELLISQRLCSHYTPAASAKGDNPRHSSGRCAVGTKARVNEGGDKSRVQRRWAVPVTLHTALPKPLWIWQESEWFLSDGCVRLQPALNPPPICLPPDLTVYLCTASTLHSVKRFSSG